jgi:hypothetical protein
VVSTTGSQSLGAQSSGVQSPLASIQAARTGVDKRPPSSSGSSGSGVSKLPAGMQAKMMAVRPCPCPLTPSHFVLGLFLWLCALLCLGCVCCALVC